MPDGKEVAHARMTSNPSYAVMSPDGRRLIGACDDGIIRQFSVPALPVSPPGNKKEDIAPLAPFTVMLAGTISDIAVGGGGRFLALKSDDSRELAIFDVNEVKVVKKIPLASASALIAAGATTLVIAYPADQLMERWNLDTLTPQGERGPSPIKGDLKSLAMGNDSDGPLMVVWAPASLNKGIEQAWFSFLDPKTMTVLKAGQIPSADPAYYLSVVGFSTPWNSTRGPVRVSVHAADGSYLLTVRDLDEMEGPVPTSAGASSNFTSEKRYHFIPSAKLLITVPFSNDRVVLRRLDIEKALQELAPSYLIVTSPPNLAATAGKPFHHQIEVKSSKSKLNYTRLSGPEGLSVSPEGEINWPSPSRSRAKNVTAVISVTDDTGNKRVHTVWIHVK
jgi:Putative Ig domain